MNQKRKIEQRQAMMAMDVLITLTLIIVLLGLAVQFHSLNLQFRRGSSGRDAALVAASNLLEKLKYASDADLLEQARLLQAQPLNLTGLPTDLQTKVEISQMTTSDVPLSQIRVTLSWDQQRAIQHLSLVGWRVAKSNSAPQNEDLTNE